MAVRNYISVGATAGTCTGSRAAESGVQGVGSTRCAQAHSTRRRHEDGRETYASGRHAGAGNWLAREGAVTGRGRGLPADGSAWIENGARGRRRSRCCSRARTRAAGHARCGNIMVQMVRSEMRAIYGAQWRATKQRPWAGVGAQCCVSAVAGRHVNIRDHTSGVDKTGRSRGPAIGGPQLAVLAAVFAIPTSMRRRRLLHAAEDAAHC